MQMRMSIKRDVHTSIQIPMACGMRRVFMPRSLFHLFIASAKSNNARDIETCGMLCGKIIDSPKDIEKIEAREREMKLPSAAMQEKVKQLQQKRTQQLQQMTSCSPSSSSSPSSSISSSSLSSLSPTPMIVATCVLVPPQHGTRDTCQAEGEEEIENYMTSNDLIMLGWIHTHPTQKAFLSSVDLHTHLPFHLMMHESVAVVCALNEGRIALFCLTQSGVDTIKRCQLRGFHRHYEDIRRAPLYGITSHTSVLSENEFVHLFNVAPKVVDLRPMRMR